MMGFEPTISRSTGVCFKPLSYILKVAFSFQGSAEVLASYYKYTTYTTNVKVKVQVSWEKRRESLT